MTDNKPSRFNMPAVKADVGFVAADTVLALRSIQLALIALKTGNPKLLDEQIANLDKHVDELWGKFQQMMGPKDE